MGGVGGTIVRNPDGGVRKPDSTRRIGWGLVVLVCGLASASAGTYPGILPVMSEQTLIVDAVEGDVARVELDGGRMLDLPIGWLPTGVGEGQVLRVLVTGDGQLSIAVDVDETERRLRENQALLDSITSKPPEDFHI
jgi:hypothetical protein